MNTVTVRNNRRRRSRHWRDYFEHNARSLLPIPWELGRELTTDERLAVASSVQGFQRGESSEGRNLHRYAKQYAARSGDNDYLASIELFIREEHRHARDLKRFLSQNGIATISATLTDRVFRRLRRLFRQLEISIAVLVTAEIIAKVYYAALRIATKSGVLRALCDQILRDERRHVEFQVEQLNEIRRNRTAIERRFHMGCQRSLFFCTCLVVWYFHRGVFRRAGMAFAIYFRNCLVEFNYAFAEARRTIHADAANAESIAR